MSDEKQEWRGKLFDVSPTPRAVKLNCCDCNAEFYGCYEIPMLCPGCQQVAMEMAKLANQLGEQFKEMKAAIIKI